MAVNRRQLIHDSLAKEVSPIQYVTENGFSIIRLCDVDKSVLPHHANVGSWSATNVGGSVKVKVTFAKSLIAQIQRRRRSRLSDSSVLWLVCAEQRPRNVSMGKRRLPNRRTVDHQRATD